MSFLFEKSFRLEDFLIKLKKGYIKCSIQENTTSLNYDLFLESVFLGCPIIFYAEEDPQGNLIIIKDVWKAELLNKYVEDLYTISKPLDPSLKLPFSKIDAINYNRFMDSYVKIYNISVNCPEDKKVLIKNSFFLKK